MRVQCAAVLFLSRRARLLRKSWAPVPLRGYRCPSAGTIKGSGMGGTGPVGWGGGAVLGATVADVGQDSAVRPRAQLAVGCHFNRHCGRGNSFMGRLPGSICSPPKSLQKSRWPRGRRTLKINAGRRHLLTACLLPLFPTFRHHAPARAGKPRGRLPYNSIDSRPPPSHLPIQSPGRFCVLRRGQKQKRSTCRTLARAARRSGKKKTPRPLSMTEIFFGNGGDSEADRGVVPSNGSFGNDNADRSLFPSAAHARPARVRRGWKVIPYPRKRAADLL